jgi:hypothetical protein
LQSKWKRQRSSLILSSFDHNRIVEGREIRLIIVLVSKDQANYEPYNQSFDLIEKRNGKIDGIGDDERIE